MNATTTPAKGDAKTKAEPLAAGTPATELPMNHPDAPHVTVHLQKGEGDDEKSGQFVSVNGNDFVVPRAVDVSVPLPVYEVLANSKRTQLSEDGSEAFEINRFSMATKGRVPSVATA